MPESKPIPKQARTSSQQIKYSLNALGKNMSATAMLLSGLFLSIFCFAFLLSNFILFTLIFDQFFIALLFLLSCFLISISLFTLLKPSVPHFFLLSIGILYAMMLIAFFSKYYSTEWYFQILIGLPVTYVFVAIFLNFFNRNTLPKNESVIEVVKETSFSELRENLTDILRNNEDLTSKLNSFQEQIEGFNIASWEREEKLEKKYYNVIRDLFLLLDHFDIMYSKGKSSEEIDFLYSRAHQILDDRGIEEINVKKGDQFDGRLHKYVGERLDQLLERGQVLEVARKGYIVRGSSSEDDLVLRESEVVVSGNYNSSVTEKKTKKEK